MNYRASRRTRVTLDQDRTVASGETITVHGILLANANAQNALVHIQDGDGNNTISVVVGCKDSFEIRSEFIADNGLVLDGLASGGIDVYVTVFHSSGGS
jgi:hypothetical protein